MQILVASPKQNFQSIKNAGARVDSQQPATFLRTTSVGLQIAAMATTTSKQPSTMPAEA